MAPHRSGANAISSFARLANDIVIARHQSDVKELYLIVQRTIHLTLTKSTVYATASIIRVGLAKLTVSTTNLEAQLNFSEI